MQRTWHVLGDTRHNLTCRLSPGRVFLEKVTVYRSQTASGGIGGSDFRHLNRLTTITGFEASDGRLGPCRDDASGAPLPRFQINDEVLLVTIEGMVGIVPSPVSPRLHSRGTIVRVRIRALDPFGTDGGSLDHAVWIRDDVRQISAPTPYDGSGLRIAPSPFCRTNSGGPCGCSNRDVWEALPQYPINADRRCAPARANLRPQPPLDGSKQDPGRRLHPPLSGAPVPQSTDHRAFARRSPRHRPCPTNCRGIVRDVRLVLFRTDIKRSGRIMTNRQP